MLRCGIRYDFVHVCIPYIRGYIFTYIHQCIFDRHGIDVTITHLSSNHQGLMNTAARCTLLPPPFFLRHLDPYPPFACPPGHPLGGVWARWVREGREVARVESLRRGIRCNVTRKKRDPCPSLSLFYWSRQIW